jgi:cold shock CspA family protein
MSVTENKETTTPATTIQPTIEGMFIGRVKWFNNVSGYGFITVTDGKHSGTDVFVHHTSIIVNNSQYKYLVQGEYVSFSLANVVKDGKDALNAVNIRGVGGGILMCETRQSMKETRESQSPPLAEDSRVSPKRPMKERSVEKDGSAEKRVSVKKTQPKK